MWIVFGETVSVCVCERASFGPPVFNINHPFQFLFPTIQAHSGGSSNFITKGWGWGGLNWSTFFAPTKRKILQNFPKLFIYMSWAAELLSLELITTGCVSSILHVSKHPMEPWPLLRKTARMSKRISEGHKCTRFLPYSTPPPLRLCRKHTFCIACQTGHQWNQ